MDHVRVEAVGPERAVRATGLVVRTEHEVVDDQLAPTIEELSQRLRSCRRVEDVVLLDPLPRELTPSSAQLVAQPAELFLACEQFLTRLDPRVAVDDPMFSHSPSLVVQPPELTFLPEAHRAVARFQAGRSSSNARRSCPPRSVASGSRSTRAQLQSAGARRSCLRWSP